MALKAFLKRVFSFGSKKVEEHPGEDTAPDAAAAAAARAAEEKARADAAAAEAARKAEEVKAATERVEAERKAAEEAATERAEAERKAAEEKEAARLAAEAEARALAEKAAAEQAETERKEAEEKARTEAKAQAAKEAEKAAAAEADEERRKAEDRAQAEAERKATEEAEAARLVAEAEAKAREEAEAQRAKADRKEAERFAAEAEKADREREEAERRAVEEAAAAKAEAARKAAEEAAAQAEAEARAQREAQEKAAEEAKRKAAHEAAAEAEAEAREREEAERKAAEEAAAKAAAEPAPEPSPTQQPAGKATVTDTVATTSEPEPAPEPVEEKRGWFQRLKQGLSRSSKELTGNIAGIFTKRRLDEDTLQDLEDVLIQADLGIETAMRITDVLASDRYGKDVSTDEVRRIMGVEVEKVLGPVALPLELDLSHRPHVILVVGVNGTGKTTTIGKLAAKLNQGGLEVMLAAGDTFRAAAIEQLKIWGERTGSPVVSSKLGADAAGLAFEAFEKAKEAGTDVLIIDTAGRLQNRTELMDELAKIVRVLGKLDPEAPHTVLQTLDATTGQNALNQVEIFRNVAGVNGLVMTKLDGTARGGILVAIAAKHKLPVYFVGVGEQVDDLEPFEAKEFAMAITGTEA